MNGPLVFEDAHLAPGLWHGPPFMGGGLRVSEAGSKRGNEKKWGGCDRICHTFRVYCVL